MSEVLNTRATRDDVEHHLRSACLASGKHFFTNKAFAMIAEQFHNIPRNINHLCFNAMFQGWTLKRLIVDELTIQAIMNDLNLRTSVFFHQKGDEQSSRRSPYSGGARSSAGRDGLFTIRVLASLAEQKVARLNSARMGMTP